ncbi:hypothetical protein PI95_031745 [Hassallia byssoidea VB512170]|uniref:Uncharacterized protein n=1 Tax=Hassallia byssoidea VB512170 TaxID=1304833 RepID=A0A846HJ75_9CYAN|nr:hypothetical protein [Hassalia byssoidea]NEU76948.1 hypothetical protein [Hassalia byssoidea VB512170]
MPTASLGRTHFPISRKTSGDAQRSIKDPFGYFSCRESTTRFLDLQDKAKTAGYATAKGRKAYTKSTTLVDGTKLTAANGGDTISVAESEITQSIGSRGSRTVIIKTGKKLPDKNVDGKTKSGGYHTISFRFPSWATVWVIADALGELIPAGKISVTPSSTEIYPYFTVKGGRKYMIMAEAAAEENSDASIPETPQEMETLATSAKLKAKKGAGGDA